MVLISQKSCKYIPTFQIIQANIHFFYSFYISNNRLHIATIGTGPVLSSETGFGPPIKMALNKLNNRESPSSQQKSKVIALISDGEDFREDTDEVIKAVQDEDIKLFSLGVRTHTGNSYPGIFNTPSLSTKLPAPRLHAPPMP